MNNGPFFLQCSLVFDTIFIVQNYFSMVAMFVIFIMETFVLFDQSLAPMWDDLYACTGSFTLNDKKTINTLKQKTKKYGSMV